MLIALFAGVVIHTGYIPHPAGRVNPSALTRTPPFDKPGVFPQGPDRLRVVMVARMWAFQPNEVRVPAGVTVAFDVASPDVIHGFHIDRTNVNAMVVPGEITHFEHTFEKPGEYRLVCHEYCGIAHQAMFGKVVVTQARTTASATVKTSSRGGSDE
jgi:cytochrome c oxidase subunit 2